MSKIKKNNRIIKPDITEETIELAKYIIKNNSTIRETARVFQISKSTVHYRMQTLRMINRELYAKVHKVFDKNWAERHIRGGQATSLYWKNKKNPDPELYEIINKRFIRQHAKRHNETNSDLYRHYGLKKKEKKNG